MALPGNRIVPFNAEWPAIREAEGGVDQWLRRQWLGERFALVEIEKVFGLAVASDVPDKVTRLLERIVADERSHVTLMEDFLAARGMLAPNRVPLAHGVFEYDLACAVASRAEATCLGTMRVVATDPATPRDLREALIGVMAQEHFHVRALERLASEGAMTRATSPEHLTWQWCDRSKPCP